MVVVDEGGAAAADRGPYHLILESVGGEVLGNVLSMLAPEGTCVSFGVSGGAEVTFDARNLYLAAGRSSTVSSYSTRSKHDRLPGDSPGSWA